jgi:uncharacterized membrane protein
VLAIAALSEHVADKLPMTPSRLQVMPLTGRLAVGALAGLCVARQARQSQWLGVGVGVGAAVLAAVLGFRLRAWIVRTTRLPDPVIALAEDALAVRLGLFGTTLR